MKKHLNIGCGNLSFPDCVTIDASPRVNPDVLHDLQCFPWPFEDERFEIVYAMDVIEHLEDVIKTVDEIHRITKPGGTLFVRTAYWQSENAFTDPTHKHVFTLKSFDYFDPSTEFGQKYSYYSDRKWKIESRGLDGEELVFKLVRL